MAPVAAAAAVRSAGPGLVHRAHPRLALPLPPPLAPGAYRDFAGASLLGSPTSTRPVEYRVFQIVSCQAK